MSDQPFLRVRSVCLAQNATRSGSDRFASLLGSSSPTQLESVAPQAWAFYMICQKFVLLRSGCTVEVNQDKPGAIFPWPLGK